MRASRSVKLAAAAAVVTAGGLAAYHYWPLPGGLPADPDYHAAEADHLDHRRDEAAARHTANKRLVRDLAEGRIGLTVAAGTLLFTNAAAPEFISGLRSYYPAPTAEASAARNLLHRVNRELAADPPRRAAVRTRLEAEYATAFGSPPGPDPE